MEVGRISTVGSLNYFFHPAPKALPAHLNSTLGKRKHLVDDLPIEALLPLVSGFHHGRKMGCLPHFMPLGWYLPERDGHSHLTKSSSDLVLLIFRNLLCPHRGSMKIRSQKSKVAGRKEELGEDGEFAGFCFWYSNALPCPSIKSCIN